LDTLYIRKTNFWLHRLHRSTSSFKLSLPTEQFRPYCCVRRNTPLLASTLRWRY